MRSRPEIRLTVAALLAVCVACASTLPESASDAARGTRNVILAAEIQAANQPNVLAAISALRPAWLSTRGQSSLVAQDHVGVYVDGARREQSDLAVMSPLVVERLEYLSASEATIRFGVQPSVGAIVVTTRKR